MNSWFIINSLPTENVVIEQNNFVQTESDWDYSTYSVVNDKLVMTETSNAWSKFVQWNVNSGFHYQTIEVEFDVNDANSIVRIGKRDWYQGIFVEADLENGFLRLWKTDLTVVLKSEAISFSLGTGTYKLKVTKQDYINPVLITIEKGTDSHTMSIGYDEFDLRNMGLMYGKCFISLNKGSVAIDKLTYTSDVKKGVKLLTIGDSIVDNGSIYDDNGFSSFAHKWDTLIRADLNGFMNMSGMPGESMPELNDRISVDVLPILPTYCLVYDKPNTEDFNFWKFYMDRIVRELVENGIKPILCTIQPAPTSERQVEITKMNNWIKASGYNYVNIAYAVSLGNDEVTYNPAVYVDGVHFNELGNGYFYNQIKTDAAYLFGSI
jgi:hypothetical protein